jgi:hypothetical protein
MSTSPLEDSGDPGLPPAGGHASEAASCAVRCQCGALQGTLARPARANRVVCYCHDCQAFAHVLNQAGRVLDARGGTDVLQTLPRNLSFTRGSEQLACLRLTSTGMLRWYARCCSTPIGNTPAAARFSFVGLIHTCLDPAGLTLDEVFGPVTAWNNTATARGDPKPVQKGVGKVFAFVIGTALRARLNGDYRHNPFFVAESGAPAATPRVLSKDEHARVMAVVRQG